MLPVISLQEKSICAWKNGTVERTYLAPRFFTSFALLLFICKTQYRWKIAWVCHGTKFFLNLELFLTILQKSSQLVSERPLKLLRERKTMKAKNTGLRSRAWPKHNMSFVIGSKNNESQQDWESSADLGTNNVVHGGSITIHKNRDQ